jgi:DNA polymerase type B, organellar and viral
MNCYNPNNVTSIMDDSNKFISISCNALTNLIEFKDSLRIFPTSLDNLCKMFAVEGKLTTYNSLFNNLEFFNNPNLLQEFINYSLQDAKALFEALFNAQTLYFNKFKVDIESIYSTATLSLKIYRTKFQEEPIYILPSNIDNFIRNSYFGGGTDVYQAYGKNLHYYDVNSLYPYAMLNSMPYELIKIHKNMNNINLIDFFGFIEAKIYCPIDMERPVLPYHSNGKTIYPVGIWQGVYFSEELKAVEKLGYKITLIKGYEFTKTDLFSNYVNTFYEIKRVATGAENLIAKLLLNNLYGYFGRKQINIQTQNIKNENLEGILLSRIVKSIAPINDNYTTILSYTNINYDLLKKLNNELHSNISNFSSPIKSNVALAAAVTAYARIVMIPFKIDPRTLYTDTDSIFTLGPIDFNLIGDQLGLMKDEMKGIIIKEALFLGPKNRASLIIICRLLA